MASIYGLYDVDGNLRYIGKANNPRKRLMSHMRDARRRRTPLYDWINKHGIPEMRVLESDCADWREAEKRLIAEARVNGARLLNVADGGDEPYCSPETRSANGRRMQSHPAVIAQRTKNGRHLANMIAGDERLRRICDIRKRMGWALKRGMVPNTARVKMRLAAAKAPHIFGDWLNLPDREEMPDGSPVGSY